MGFGGTGGFAAPPGEAAPDLEHYFSQIQAEIEELFGGILPSGSSGEFLRHDGSDWVGATISSGDLPSHNHAAGDINSGTFANARISEASVTQHEAALAIAFTQLTGSIANGQVPQSAVTQHQAALAIAYSQMTGNIPEAQVTQHEAALSIGASQITPGTFGAGDYVFRHPSASVDVSIRSDAGLESRLNLMDLDGTLRWAIKKNADAESGSNAGSNFMILARNDTGTAIGTALEITRSSMLATFGGSLRAPDGSVSGAAFGFDNDPDTGMYLSAVGTLAFATGGVLGATLQSDSDFVVEGDVYADGGSTLLGAGPHTAQATLNFGSSVASGATAATTMTVTGSTLGDAVAVSTNQSGSYQLTARSGVDLITVYITNHTGSTQDLSSVQVNAAVFNI